jgi:hypothetical protein
MTGKGTSLYIFFQKFYYMYDYITKLCRRQAEVIENHLNPNVWATGQVEAMHRKHKQLKLGTGQAYDHSGVLTAILERINKLRHNLLHKTALT